MGESYYGRYSYPDEYTVWERKFAWRRQTCGITGKKLWLKFAYCGTRVITGPGTPVFLKFWHDEQEHFIWKLKGN